MFSKTLESPPSETALKLLEELQSKAATGMNGETQAVFYGGKRAIGIKEVANYSLATDYVKQHPGSYTIDDTEAGQFVSDSIKKLKQVGEPLAAHEEKMLWSRASQQMAQQAKGNAVIFSGGKIQDVSVLTNYELVEMMGNNGGVPSMNEIKVAKLDALVENNPQANWKTLTKNLAKNEPVFELSPGVLEGAPINPKIVAAAKGFAPIALGLGGLIEGGVDGYESYKRGDNGSDIAANTGAGAAKGTFKAAFPGAEQGYDDITNGDGKHRTWLDRTLNAASDASQTTAVTASGVAIAGAATGPADAVPVLVASSAAAVNVGANLLKAGVKLSGMAGDGQDGGYIYDGGAAVGTGFTNGAQWTADKIDGMIFGGQDTKMYAPTLPTPAGEQQVTGATKSGR